MELMQALGLGYPSILYFVFCIFYIYNVLVFYSTTILRFEESESDQGDRWPLTRLWILLYRCIICITSNYCSTSFYPSLVNLLHSAIRNPQPAIRSSFAVRNSRLLILPNQPVTREYQTSTLRDNALQTVTLTYLPFSIHYYRLLAHQTDFVSRGRDPYRTFSFKTTTFMYELASRLVPYLESIHKYNPSLHPGPSLSHPILHSLHHSRHHPFAPPLPLPLPLLAFSWLAYYPHSVTAK